MAAARRAAERAAEREARDRRWNLNADFSLEVIYDDNICRYSDATLMEFRTGAKPALFAIETYDDLILNPTLQVELDRRRLLLGKRTRFRVRYKLWQYARNDVKTNDEINLRFRQTFRRLDYLEATYTYAPNSYIKELSDRPLPALGQTFGGQLHVRPMYILPIQHLYPQLL